MTRRDDHPTALGVSVILPAFNAARTLHEPLDALLAQSHEAWEAIIVDDGSSDETAAVAERYAKRDRRIQLVRQANAGVSVARNRGIAEARHDWLLFLDADDTIAPEHLRLMTAALARDDSLDAVRSGWCSVTSDGHRTCESVPRRVGDLFEQLATDWRFAIHACVLRKTVAQEAGGFEPGLRTSEDWDFWQRVARTGARFGAVPEVLAFYRMRKGSASKQARSMLVDAIRVLEQGHAPDSRVPRPHPVYPKGVPVDRKFVLFQKYYYLCFSAGLALGVGDDPESLLDELTGETFPELDPHFVADWITSAAMDASGRPLAEWPEAWSELETAAERFLQALEQQVEAPGLARRTALTARALLQVKTVPLGSSYRLRALPAWLRLVTSTLRQDVKKGVWLVAEQMLRLATQGLRMAPGFYARYRRFRQRHAFPESRRNLEEFFEEREDPWGYTNEYEQTKYEQTLELIPEVPIAKALEIGCAEGHFTAQLAPRTASLLAVDISQTALDRAAERCGDHPQVRFEQLDLTRDPIPGQFDLIVCSEVLYYFGRRDRLRSFVDKLTAALTPGGQLVMAHANLAVDDPESAGFDWGFNYGAKAISEVFSAAPELGFEQELRTKFYRVQRFVHDAESPSRSPEILVRSAAAPPPEVARHWVEDGVTDRLPILMYHRIADSGSAELAPYRVTPAAFEAQIRYLSEQGFVGVSLEDWSQHVIYGSSLPRGAVAITFDDGYKDFAEHAWPVLERYGFQATVFLVADRIGGTNVWDQEEFGETLPLLDWREVRELQAAGVEFGSHTATHPWLPSLSWAAAARELRRSRKVLEDGLGAPVTSVAYPWGAFGKAVQFLAGASGYEVAVSTAPGICEARHSLLALPRIEIEGGDTLESFAAKLETPLANDAPSISTAAVRAPSFT